MKKRFHFYLAAVDIETESQTNNPQGALVPHLSNITVIGAVTANSRRTFRGPTAIEQLKDFLISEGVTDIVGHNFKFDLRKIIYDRPDLKDFFLELWSEDTLLQAHNFPEKVIDAFLSQYEEARAKENEELPGRALHRKGGPLSLKVLAPYFLRVDPFWETPEDHDNDEYVLKDCDYTLKLWNYFNTRFTLEFPDAQKFYYECQFPWTRMLLTAELLGVKIDTQLMGELFIDQMSIRSETKIKLDTLWHKIEQDMISQQVADLKKRYDEMCSEALKKSKVEANNEKIRARYEALFHKALETQRGTFGLNLSSPTQLLRVLRDHQGYDVRDFNGKDSTGKEVLQRLADEGKEDVKLLLNYRKSDKLVTAYFPSYKEFIRKDSDSMHPTFNPAGARTGRLSSSTPNCQQVAPVLRDMFIARPNKLLVTKDLSALEPVLIAYFSADPQLMKIVQEGLSFHCVNTKAIFDLDTPLEQIKDKHKDLRKIAKEFGLSVLYGAGARRVQQSFLKYGVHRDLNECRRYVDRLRETYAGVWEFKENLDRMLKQGEVLYNYMGRPIIFNDPEEVYMKGFNRLIQGSGSDILQQSALDISEEPGLDVLLLVHDELVVEVPEKTAASAEKLVEHHMTKWDLTNELGTVKFTVEGGVSTRWKK